MTTKNNLEKRVETKTKNQLQILDFWAPKCTACENLGLFLDQLQEKYGDAFELTKINAREYEEERLKFRVMHVPTLIFLKDGDLVFRRVGFDNMPNNKQVIENEIMNHLRR